LKKEKSNIMQQKGNFDKRQPKFRVTTTTSAATTTTTTSWLIFYQRSWPLLFYHEVCCHLYSHKWIFWNSFTIIIQNVSRTWINNKARWWYIIGSILTTFKKSVFLRQLGHLCLKFKSPKANFACPIFWNAL